MKSQHAPAHTGGGGSGSGTTRPVTVPKVDLDALLAKFGAKDRQTFDRQLAAREAHAPASPHLVDRWRRLAGLLMTLAPAPPKLAGVDTMQFFIPDGKYRKQVYAIHASADGTIDVYVPDILETAARAHLLSGPAGKVSDTGRVNLYRVVDSKESLRIESLDGATVNPSPFYKDMTGWNRKAVSVQLPPSASDEQLEAVERLCALAATTWAGAVAAAAAAGEPARPKA
jgi:hypothetical protein